MNEVRYAGTGLGAHRSTGRHARQVTTHTERGIEMAAAIGVVAARATPRSECHHDETARSDTMEAMAILRMTHSPGGCRQSRFPPGRFSFGHS